MNTYVISYDLINPGQNYDNLIKAIKAYGSYCHLQKSVWIIATDQSASSIRDKLKIYLDQNDKLFVAKVSAPAAWYGYDAAQTKWLKEQL